MKTRFLSKLAFGALCLIVTLMSPSCVHEWPEDVTYEREIILNVNHIPGWEDPYTMEVTRAGQSSKTRYHFRVYAVGDQTNMLKETVFCRDDLSRSDFSTTISLPPGSYDLWAWTDYADADSEESLFFDTSDFSSVWYPEPYLGNNEMRDAMRGAVSFSIDATPVADYHQEIDLTMERPLARYEFIATDLAEFIDNEETRGQLSRTKSKYVTDSGISSLDGYRVNMIYTGYMPSHFNNFLNRPVDSRTGMHYDADINVLNENEARLGFDYVMVNGHESSIAVAMEVYDPDGKLIGRTNTINVPTQRNRNTIVRGRFLTSRATGGVGINPDFDGDINIEIK